MHGPSGIDFNKLLLYSRAAVGTLDERLDRLQGIFGGGMVSFNTAEKIPGCKYGVVLCHAHGWWC